MTDTPDPLAHLYAETGADLEPPDFVDHETTLAELTVIGPAELEVLSEHDVDELALIVRRLVENTPAPWVAVVERELAALELGTYDEDRRPMLAMNDNGRRVLLRVLEMLREGTSSESGR